jgi:hypothetical protein
VTPDQAGTGTNTPYPPLDSEWDNASVTVFVEVADPDQNADDVAGNDNVDLLAGNSGTPGSGGLTMPNGQPPTIYVNHPQTCTIRCSDGLPFSFTVPVGTFRAYSQANADRAAYNFACKRASANRVCLSDINGGACVGQSFSQTIEADAANVPISFAVTGGTIPPWMNFSVGTSSVTLTGIPNSSEVGTTIFTITATDSLGFTMVKDYAIAVAECGGTCMISESTLPAFDQGQFYSAQLHATGGTAPYEFFISVGTLPDGLTMSTTGLISGTVDLTNGNLDQTFTVECFDSGSPIASCEKSITLPVLDYHVFPPGKKWRIKTYADGTFDSSCNTPVVSAFTWDGTFDVNTLGSGWFSWSTIAGLLNSGVLRAAKPFLNAGQLPAVGPEWFIYMVDYFTNSTPTAWFGRKVGSNAGVKLDSPAGTYTSYPAGAAIAGYALCNTAPATVIIEEY